MRRSLLGLVAVALLVVPAEGARSSEARKGLRALLAAIEPRQGVAHRSLVVVPLVSRGEPPAGGPQVPESGLAWEPVEGKRSKELATIRAKGPAAGIAAEPLLLPSGLVLRQDKAERLLLHPTLLLPGAPLSVNTLPLEPLPKAKAAVSEKAAGTLAGLAPPEFRHAAFLLSRADALRDLLALEATLAGLDPRDKPVALADVFKVPGLAKRLAAARGSLSKLAKAYGGEVLGHVAYLGNRPVEMVLASSPASYQSFLKQAVPGLALALVIWEELHGRTGLPMKAAPWPQFTAETARILKKLSTASMRQERLGQRAPANGELWRVRATMDPRGKRPPDVGWLLLSSKAKPIWFEAWPEGAVGPLPGPARKPGGPPEGEDQGDRKSGAMTRYFIERFLKRFPWRRGR